MVIKIPHSKGDQLRKGDEVIIASSGKVTCPVSYLENFQVGQVHHCRSQDLSSALYASPKQVNVCGSQAACLWEYFKRKVSKLGYNPTDFAVQLNIRRPMQEFLIDCSNVMDVGSLRMLRMAT